MDVMGEEIFIFVRLRLLKAVSVAEKNADMVTKISITIIVVVLSIRLKNSPFLLK